MLKTNGYGIGGIGYKGNAAGTRKSKETKAGSAASGVSAQKADKPEIENDPIRSSESKLSAKAQKYLAGLREKYGDYDFIVANADDDTEGLIGQSTKEIAVVFSTEELEKMADDENFAAQQMKNVDKAVKISKMLMGEDGDMQLEDGVTVSNVSISFDSEGTMKLFADLEKSTATMNERSEEAAKKRAEEKKEAKKADAEKKASEKDNAKKNDSKTVSCRRTSVEAGSIDELLDKIGAVDWDKITPETLIIGEPGSRYA